MIIIGVNIVVPFIVGGLMKSGLIKVSSSPNDTERY